MIHLLLACDTENSLFDILSNQEVKPEFTTIEANIDNSFNNYKNYEVKTDKEDKEGKEDNDKSEVKKTINTIVMKHANNKNRTSPPAIDREKCYNDFIINSVINLENQKLEKEESNGEVDVAEVNKNSTNNDVNVNNNTNKSVNTNIQNINNKDNSNINNVNSNKNNLLISIEEDKVNTEENYNIIVDAEKSKSYLDFDNSFQFDGTPNKPAIIHNNLNNMSEIKEIDDNPKDNHNTSQVIVAKLDDKSKMISMKELYKKQRTKSNFFNSDDLQVVVKKDADHLIQSNLKKLHEQSSVSIMSIAPIGDSRIGDSRSGIFANNLINHQLFSPNSIYDDKTLNNNHRKNTESFDNNSNALDIGFDFPLIQRTNKDFYNDNNDKSNCDLLDKISIVSPKNNTDNFNITNTTNININIDQNSESKTDKEGKKKNDFNNNNNIDFETLLRQYKKKNLENLSVAKEISIDIINSNNNNSSRAIEKVKKEKKEKIITIDLDKSNDNHISNKEEDGHHTHKGEHLHHKDLKDNKDHSTAKQTKKDFRPDSCKALIQPFQPQFHEFKITPSLTSSSTTNDKNKASNNLGLGMGLGLGSISNIISPKNYQFNNNININNIEKVKTKNYNNIQDTKNLKKSKELIKVTRIIPNPKSKTKSLCQNELISTTK